MAGTQDAEFASQGAHATVLAALQLLVSRAKANGGGYYTYRGVC